MRTLYWLDASFLHFLLWELHEIKKNAGKRFGKLYLFFVAN
nr:MAG TPA: hypothetical protein [Caudoviricetes sp.]